MDEFRHQKELSTQSRLFGGDGGQQFSEDIELLGFGNADSNERLSDTFDGVFQWEQKLMAQHPVLWSTLFSKNCSIQFLMC